MVGNWGRWGVHDEIGIANLLDAGMVLRARELVREGVVLSLAQPLGPSTAMPPHRQGVRRIMDRHAGDYGETSSNGFRYAEDTISLSTHAGTHIDALAHVWAGDQLYNGHLASTQDGRGASRCGADKLAPIVSRGVLLNFVPGGSTVMPADGAIGPRELERAYERVGLKPEPGDAVLLRTGWWSANQHDPRAYFAREPGLSYEGAAWLARHDPVVVGADNYAVECVPSPSGERFPVHVLLMRDHGIPLLENLALDELHATGRSDFMLVLAPLGFEGSTGSPVNPLAVL